MIAVMGASGHTGHALAHRLLDAGQPVRAIGRSASRLAGLRQRGAALAIGDLADTAFLADALSGVDAAYALLPTDRRVADFTRQQQREGESIADALRVSGVRRVVALSSLGTHLDADTGLIGGLRAQEERMADLPGVHVLTLRPVSFFENFLDALDGIRAHGAVFDSVLPDLPLPLIGARDIAEVAADALIDARWDGAVVRELLGPAELTWREATSLVGHAIGQPDLPYVQLPDDDLVAAMVAGGVSPEFAELYVAMTRAFNTGVVQPSGPIADADRATTSFAQFSRELAETYRHA